MKKKKKSDRKKELEALKKENERAVIAQIRRLLALPPNKRTNFLRKRRPVIGSCL